MQRLGQQDAMFLYSEKPRAPMHLCSFHFYAPDPNGHRLTFDEFREHVHSRLPLARLLRRKLVRVPLDLDYPYWVEDRDFDLDHHVRHVTLEGDRDWRAVWDLAAALHSIPIDLHRPPWELYLIDGIDHVEGYEPGGFAMLIKIHHCAIDGIAGIELMNALHDLDPEGRPPVVDTWQPEATPDPLTLLAMTAANAAQSPLRAARFLTHSVPMLLRPRPALRAAWDATAGGPKPPTTRLNQRVTTNRVGDAVVIDLAEAKRVRTAVPGATVNDVLLTVVGGGLRQYLGETGELPDEPMMAGVPMSMRTDADAGTGGNKIAMMLVSLGTDVADARQRLTMVHRSTSQSKEQNQAVEARVMAEGAELLPGGLLGLAVRANSMQGAGGVTAQIGNVCVTNVPGSQAPLYLRGYQMLAYYSLGPVYDNAGPIHLIVSYLGQVYLSVTSCREIVPDIERYVDCLRQSWDELVAATVGPPRSGRARPAATGPARRSGRPRRREDAAGPSGAGRRRRRGSRRRRGRPRDTKASAMKAVRLVEWKHAPEVVDVDEPTPGAGEVLVRIGGAGICHTDISLIHVLDTGMLPFEPPFTLGHENAGWVAQLGDGVRGLEVGQPVVVYGPWGCGLCHNCAGGAENHCERPDVVGAEVGGLGRDGGLAPLMIVPSARHLVPLTDLEPWQAAPLADAALTPYRVIRKWRHLLVPGSSAVVLGAGGGLGHLAVQLLRELTPARIVGVDASPGGVQRALDLGATVAVRASDTTATEVRDATGGRGAELVLDFVGSADTLAVAAAVVRPLGHVAIVGSGGGTLTCGYFGLPYEVSVSTTYWGSIPELIEVVELAEQGRIASQVQTFPFSRALDALEALHAGTVEGRAVVVPD